MTDRNKMILPRFILSDIFLFEMSHYKWLCIKIETSILDIFSVIYFILSS